MRHLLLIALLAAGGCANLHRGREPAGTVTHVVLIWLKDRADAEAKQKLIDATMNFRGLPGMQRIDFGTPLPSTRPVVDGSYDLAIVMTFENEDALRRYESDPRHLRATREVMQPLAKQVKIYDMRGMRD